MEREILIANTKTQKRSKITTSATTLGELKTDLRAAGIDFSGMTFTEGISKIQLLDDGTQLPQNVMYKGQPTNNLVILLTNTKKNISSGTLSRQEIKNIIKCNNLQEAIKNKFGRNYTQVSNKDLELFIDTNVKQQQTMKSDAPNEKNVVNEQESVVSTEHTFTTDKSDVTTSTLVVDSLYSHITTLTDMSILSVSDLQKLERNIHKLVITMSDEQEDTDKPVAQGQSASTSDNLIDDDDIDDIINDLGL